MKVWEKAHQLAVKEILTSFIQKLRAKSFLNKDDERMIGYLTMRRFIVHLCIILALIFIPIASAFADTFNHVYDDLNRLNS